MSEVAHNLQVHTERPLTDGWHITFGWCGTNGSLTLPDRPQALKLFWRLKDAHDKQL